MASTLEFQPFFLGTSLLLAIRYLSPIFKTDTLSNQSAQAWALRNMSQIYRPNPLR